MCNNHKYLCLLIISLFAWSCKVSDKTTIPRNLEGIYNPASTSVHPETEVYNTSDTSSLIIEKIYSKELLFNQANKENKLLANVLIKFSLYDLNDKQRLVDSLTTTYKLSKNPDKSFYTFKIPVNTLKGNDYILEIITLDQNRNSSQFSFFRISRSNELNNQDFIVFNKNDDEFLTNHNIKSNLQFGIKHYKKAFDSLNVFYFRNTDTVPEPPHIRDTITENFLNPDTIWVCILDSILYENFNNEGVYYFSPNKKPVNGFALYNFGSGFPAIRTPDELFKPLKYLGNNLEVADEDSTGKMTKLAVDNFWLEKANNVNKSRELLKEYYTRVMFANLYFSSIKEGWQTDRGMIYIIFGLPDYLYKSGEEEKWIYNPASIGPGISFSFLYYKNPFSLNHYVLQRGKIKFSGWDWDQAIKMWNKGEIFYYQN
ncbi:MAG: GWxTD domain-containing protein [Bacteroidales bacterium]|nr:GWxTD domain-containing protein [Bacteroidales bacterium]